MAANLRDHPLLVLGIESSCDDTAAGVVRRLPDGSCQILSNAVWTNHLDHAAYGGVVPEIAARSHVERLDATVAKALQDANVAMPELDGVAATAGPGLIGGVMAGLTTAKALAMAHEKPLLPINHLEGHALSARMTEDVEFPYLLLLISGCHTQLLWVSGVGAYERIGTTIDDAAGESFDKIAKLLDLGQPGGPHLERAAASGRRERFKFPSPLSKREGCDFSFSGLKTAVREMASALEPLTETDIADIAASFQHAVARHLSSRTEKAIRDKSHSSLGHLVVAGGVAANSAVRVGLLAICKKYDWRFIAPPPKYCTDNGAMIAWAGAERLASGMAIADDDALAFAPRARWPLAEPHKGAGNWGRPERAEGIKKRGSRGDNFRVLDLLASLGGGPSVTGGRGRDAGKWFYTIVAPETA